MIKEQTFNRQTAFPMCQTRDEIKKWLEAAHKTPGVDEPRDFVWDIRNETVFLRREKLVHGLELAVPSAGMTIHFDVLVAPKKGSSKKVLTNREEFLAWLPPRMETAGLSLISFDFVSGRTLVGRRPTKSTYAAKCRTILLGDPEAMFLHTVEYTGSASVTDSEKLAHSLTNGLPSVGKCWGFGFLHINTEN